MLGALIALIVLLCCGQMVGWNPTWRTFGVTPLEPHFFDMHVPIDYAMCASKGIDPYAPRACNWRISIFPQYGFGSIILGTQGQMRLGFLWG